MELLADAARRQAEMLAEYLRQLDHDGPADQAVAPETFTEELHDLDVRADRRP